MKFRIFATVIASAAVALGTASAASALTPPSGFKGTGSKSGTAYVTAKWSGMVGSAKTYMMWIDTSATKALFVVGYQEPKGLPHPTNGATPKRDLPNLAATFNGAFVLGDAMGGAYASGKTVGSLVSGRASAVVYKDGSIKIGKWGSDVRMTSQVAAVRQNLNLIVEGGRNKATNAANDKSVWGPVTKGESPRQWRSAVGQRADGSIVYVIGSNMNAKELGDALVKGGAQRAMVLDMNNLWPSGAIFTSKGSGTPKCSKLDPADGNSCDQYTHSSKRDSFQFVLN